MLGIAGFGTGGGFSAVINSLLPVAMGGGVSSSDAVEEEVEKGESSQNEDIENEVMLNDVD